MGYANPTAKSGKPIFVPGGVSKAGAQEVSNPGRLSRYAAPVQAAQNKALRLEVDKLTKWVASLEEKVSAVAEAAPAVAAPASVDRRDALTPQSDAAAAIDVLLDRLAKLDAAAVRPGSAPPAPVRYDSLPKSDAGTVVSWSADAYGKAKQPGWYHTSRKQIYQHRSKLAKEAPTGVFVSHSKYADEAFRIKSTGRLAF